MKKLLVLLVLLVSGLGYSQNFKLSDVVGKFQTRYDSHFDYDSSLNQYIYVKELVRETEPLRDSLKREFIQVEAVKKLNAIRKEKGMKPLIFEEALRPAAYHNSFYNRYMFEHKIESRIGDDYTSYMTHNQTHDIPNFEEIEYPWDRVKLCDRSKIQSITEELTQSWGYDESKWTFSQTCDKIWEHYGICDAHWNALTKNPKWDCVFVYKDCENGVVVTILGKYTEEYKKEMGL